MGVQQYGSQHVSSNTARRRSYEVQLRQVILLTSYGTCLHVAGSVGDKPGPGSRRVLINKKEKRSVVLIIHINVYILRYCPTGGKLDPALTICELGICSSPKEEEWIICGQCQHTWHLVCTDETDDPFHCLNCRGLGKHE